MTYGICGLSLIPLRKAGEHNSPLVSEVLYGELLQILKSHKHWSKVRLQDHTEGWLNNTQFKVISEQEYNSLIQEKAQVSIDLVELIYKDQQVLFTIPIGSHVQNTSFLGHKFEGGTSKLDADKKRIVEIAFMFLNTPFRHGGKSPFGIDASGFVQLVYSLVGLTLPRTEVAQAEKGDVLSFIEESTAGDLAFFDDAEGTIIHVGIILEHNYIIHAHGYVRIDRLDQSGIFNPELRKHTHKLRLIKSIV